MRLIACQATALTMRHGQNAALLTKQHSLQCAAFMMPMLAMALSAHTSQVWSRKRSTLLAQDGITASASFRMHRTASSTSAYEVGEGMNTTLLARHFGINDVTILNLIHLLLPGRADRPSHTIIVSKGASDGQHPAENPTPPEDDISSGNIAH